MVQLFDFKASIAYAFALHFELGREDTLHDGYSSVSGGSSG